LLKWAALATAMVVPWLVGCQVRPHTPIATEPLAAPSVLSGAALRSEIERQVRIFEVAEAAQAACLRGLGFSYETRTVEVTLTSGEALYNHSESLRRFGYGIYNNEGSAGVSVASRGGSVPHDQQAMVVEALSPGGACEAAANDIDVQVNLQKAADELANFPPRLMADQRMIAAMTAWRRCMKRRGYPFVSSEAAFDYVADLASRAQSQSQRTEELRLEEIAIATADADCFDQEVRSVALALQANA